MQKISALVVFFGAVLSVAWTQAEEPSIELFPVGAPCLAPPSADGGLPCAGPCCGRPCLRHEPVGFSACCCRGSYKYPVPPQSTYWWPGIYSQQTMTEYVSPWRHPPLLMPDVMDGASAALNAPPVHSPAKAVAPAKPAH